MLGVLVSVAALLARDPAIDARLNDVALHALDKGGQPMRPSDLALAFGDLENGHVRFGSYRGGDRFYPASVVKLFYLACLEDKLATGALTMNPELERARRDMIVDSINDATGLVLETLTGTTGGPSLPPKELAAWKDRRQEVNRWLAARGFANINASQKTWNEGPYGRERQGYGPNMEGSNALTAEACLGMMAGIHLGVWHREAERATMLGLLRRVPTADRTKDTPPDEQSTQFTGAVLPKGWKLWSKAGWTSKVSHDVALVETPTGKRHILVVFTRGYADDANVVPRLSRAVLAACDPEFPK